MRRLLPITLLLALAAGCGSDDEPRRLTEVTEQRARDVATEVLDDYVDGRAARVCARLSDRRREDTGDALGTTCEKALAQIVSDSPRPSTPLERGNAKLFRPSGVGDVERTERRSPRHVRVFVATEWEDLTGAEERAVSKSLGADMLAQLEREHRAPMPVDVLLERGRAVVEFPPPS